MALIEVTPAIVDTSISLKTWRHRARMDRDGADHAIKRLTP